MEKWKGNKPLVSVLICTYNAAEFIEGTIRSILQQTYPNFELLILDNDSRDNTAELVSSTADGDKRIRLIAYKTNLGAYPGLNYLLERAKGHYIAINDHDDIWHPEKLQRQIRFLEENKSYPGCGSAILNWYKNYDKCVYRKQPMEAKVAWHTSLVFRNHGYRYDISIPVATDFHFIKNVLCAGGKHIHNLSEPLVLRRIFSNGSNLSSRWIKRNRLTDIISLNIGIADKISLVNRYFMPNELVDYLTVSLFAGNNAISGAQISNSPILQPYSEYFTKK